MLRICQAAACRGRLLLLPLLLLVHAPLQAQDFDQAEFASRRAKLLAAIPDGVAIVFGGMEHPYSVRFRQAPDFYYLTGLEEPGAVLVLNGASKNIAVFAVKSPQFGPSATTALREEKNAVGRWGISVLPMEAFFTFLSFAATSPAVKRLYLPLSPPDDQLHNRAEARILAATALDHPLLGGSQPWARAIERIRGVAPHLEAVDLSPLIDELRWVKTGYEIERMRRSGRIGAEAVAEAIRATRPGLYEYDIAAAAQYVNTRLGARGDGFPPIVPSGPLTPIVHYMDKDRKSVV